MAMKIGLALGSGAVGAAFVTGKLPALRERMEKFGRRHVAAMFDVRLSTGGVIEGKHIENLLDELGISGAIETLPTRYAAVAADLRAGREVWLQKGPIGRAVRASIAMPAIPLTFSCVRDWAISAGSIFTARRKRSPKAWRASRPPRQSSARCAPLLTNSRRRGRNSETVERWHGSALS
jgi:hypothetical protein